LRVPVGFFISPRKISGTQRFHPNPFQFIVQHPCTGIAQYSDWTAGKLTKKPRQASSTGFLPGIFFGHADGAAGPFETSVAFNGIHAVISREIKFFRSTAVRT
jgi:hypothetical protein